VDALSNIQLHYASDQVTTGLIRLALVAANKQPVCVWFSSTGTEVVPVPFFTDRYPFLCAVASDYAMHFDPEPTRITADGICYTSLIYYRLQAPHTFPLWHDSQQEQFEKESSLYIAYKDGSVTIGTVGNKNTPS
jgi:hypothetical protein